MFQNCSKFTSLDIRNMNFSNVTSYIAMFTYIPNNCKIIANSDGKTWINTNFSNLTNVVIA